jgi:Type III restriction enzyme, res subunit
VVADECHHVPAAAFEHAVKQIPARRWLGLTATPYRRDKLDDLIALQVGPVRHTISTPTGGRKSGTDGFATQSPELDLPVGGTSSRPAPVLAVHPTSFCYTGDADPSAPGGIAAVYRDLVADEARTRQVADDVTEALRRGRHCLVLTKWVAHLDRLAGALLERGWDPVILRGGMGAKARKAALARLHPEPGGPPLLVVATGPYIGEGFDCPALDTLFWPRRSVTRAVSSSGPGGSCASTRARPPRRSTTITTSAHPCSPRAWPGAPLGTPTSASPTPAGPVLRHLQMPNAAVPVCAGAPVVSRFPQAW